jgi:hypothetical protein
MLDLKVAVLVVENAAHQWRVVRPCVTWLQLWQFYQRHAVVNAAAGRECSTSAAYQQQHSSMIGSLVDSMNDRITLCRAVHMKIRR